MDVETEEIYGATTLLAVLETTALHGFHGHTVPYMQKVLTFLKSKGRWPAGAKRPVSPADTLDLVLRILLPRASNEEHGAAMDLADTNGVTPLAASRRAGQDRCESLLLRAAMLRSRGVFSLAWTPESHPLFVESDRQIIAKVGRVLLLVAKRKPRYGVNDDVVFVVVRRCV